MRRAALLFALALLASACNELLGIPSPSLRDDGGSEPSPDAGDDASTPDDDANPPDGDADPSDGGGHLLLTEVRANGNSSEFVEVFNPLSEPVELRDYYLTDEPTYYLLPRDGASLLVGNGDFLVRFPRAALGPGQAVVVALEEDGFVTEFETPPDYTVTPAAGEPVAEPMEVVAGTISQPITINDNSEVIILFRWDGEADLVTDVDMVHVGDTAEDPGTDNGLPNKTGVSVDGPDDDDLASTYLADATSMLPMTTRNGGSYQRIALEAGSEIASGGNGVGGHDETSEDTRMTWIQDNYTPPNPGVVDLDP